MQRRMDRYKNNKFNFEEGDDYFDNNYLDELSFENSGSVINDNEYEVDSDSENEKETDI